MTVVVRSASLAVAMVLLDPAAAQAAHADRAAYAGAHAAHADAHADRAGDVVVVAPDPGDRVGLAALVELTVRRLLLADEVAAAKLGDGRPITDPVRERRLLGAVADLAARAGLAPEAGVRFFRAQIEAGKMVQRGLHARWRAHPELRPGRRPDLAAEVRPRLDRLTPPLLRLLKQTEPVRASAGRCRAGLAAALLAVGTRTVLDRLHRDALDAALAPLCSPGQAERVT
ncbi:chorismate mutase [Nonomuraea thailandensis]|uniref:chorismate mutase n=1 Tax=Nonomuraea thailandensis TaxID=1188745 RepID=A0A9X2GU56_9ACTN|nr:gamma subclass chorismate mutase AroQ [Nonomuraea thailandensis]MCP2363784.1 chorismate mutase [Nonomuraea thailandensis]